MDLTEELNQTIYEESQGIVDIAVKLFALSQGRAIETGQETITPALINKVANDDLKLVQPMLKALKDGRLSELEKYEDIMPMDIAEYLQHHQSKIDLRASIQKKKAIIAEQKKEVRITLVEKIMLTLINFDVDPSIAEKFTTKAINELPQSSEVEIVGRAMQLLAEEKNKKKRNRTKEHENKLKLVIDKGKKEQKSAYEALKETGYIKLPQDDFAI